MLWVFCFCPYLLSPGLKTRAKEIGRDDFDFLRYCEIAILQYRNITCSRMKQPNISNRDSSAETNFLQRYLIFFCSGLL